VRIVAHVDMDAFYAAVEAQGFLFQQFRPFRSCTPHPLYFVNDSNARAS
jgi:hypothetical protein